MRIGELFAGYGGLGMGVKAAIGGEVAWVSDVDKGANKVLAHRFPGVPNLGDITTIDWSAVEPVDVLTGGFPCQDVSSAGKRAGIRPGTRSGLWTHFAYAIDQLRPSLVVIENVRGLLSAEAHSVMEPCPWCVGDDPDGVMRALGAVLGDLADLGFDADWHGLRAADVGAPHGRFRIFIVAYPRTAADAERRGLNGWASDALGQPLERTAAAGSGEGALLPTPVADNSRGLPSHGTDYQSLPNAVVSLLPTPAVNDMGEGKTPQAWDEWTAKMKAAHGNGNGHGPSLAIEAQRLLPTPMVGDAASACNSTATRHKTPPTGVHAGDTLTDVLRGSQAWGQYFEAILRWEFLTRPAPPPTETGPKGNPRLNPAFSEWMMGLPAGWITDVPGVTRNEALKLAGNGVCPQQCEAALRILLPLAVAA